MKYAQFLAAALLWSVAVCPAAITGTSQEAQLNDFAGAIIASDAANASPGYDRDALHASLTVDFSKDTPPGTLESQDFRVKFRLQLATGATQTLTGGVAFVTDDFTCNLPFATLNHRSHTFTADLVPQNRLVPGGFYRIQAQLFSVTGGVETLVATKTTSPQHIWHFPSTNANDAALNVAARIETAPAWNTVALMRGPESKFNFFTTLTLARYDGWNSAAAVTDSFNATLRYALRDETAGVDIPIVQDEFTQVFSLPSWTTSGGVRTFSSISGLSGGTVQPVNWNDIHPLHEFRIRAELMNVDTPALVEGAFNSATHRLLALSGNIQFGTTWLTFTDYQKTPDPTATLVPGVFGHPAMGPLTIAFGHGRAGFGGSHFWGFTNQNVVITADGDLLYDDTETLDILRTAAPDISDVNGTRIIRTGITADAAGVRAATVKYLLPRGMGILQTPFHKRLITKLSAVNAALDGDLLPAPPPIPANTIVVLDRLPLHFYTGNLSTAGWQYTFTPTAVIYDKLFWKLIVDQEHARPGQPLAAGLDFTLFSNDGVFGNPVPAGPVTLSGTNNGDLSIVSLQVGMPAGIFFPHFPVNTGVVWTDTATTSFFRITNDAVDPASGLRDGTPTPYFVRYRTDAPPEKSCGSPPVPQYRYAGVRPDASGYRFTADGGLVAEGTAVQRPVGDSFYPDGVFREIAWGQTLPLGGNTHPVHETEAFTAGRVHIPGSFLKARTAGAGVDPGLAAVDTALWPAALLLSGAGTDPALTLQRPGTTAYQQGTGDYAGLNFRAPAGGALMATSYLGGEPIGPYALSETSKYYVREAGLTGRHASTAPLALTPHFYGYDFTLTNIRLGYLDNRNLSSAIEGSVGVPSVAGGNLNPGLTFDALTFKSNGELDQCALANPAPLSFAYWDATVQPISLDFKQPDPCSAMAGNGFMSLGVTATIPALAGTEQFSGYLGVRGENDGIYLRGDFISAQDPLAFGIKFDSRLKAPANITLKGPGSTRYTLAPSSGVYFNSYSVAARGGPLPNNGGGWVNLAGMMDVPFFQDMPVHILARGAPNATQGEVLAITGGFNENSQPVTMDAAFDQSNKGFPHVFQAEFTDGTPIDDFNAYTTGTLYAPRAKKFWLDLVDFDIPVAWQGAFNKFSGAETSPSSLALLKMHKQVPSLTPTTADVRFTASAAAPVSISPAAIAGDFLELTGLPQQLKNLVLTRVAKLNELLSDKAEDVLAEGLATATDPVADALYAQLQPIPDAAGQFTAFGDSFAGGSPVLNMGTFGPLLQESGAWLGRIRAGVDFGVEACDAALSLFDNVQKIKDLAAVLGGTGAEPDSATLQEVETQLKAVRAEIQEVKADLLAVRTELDAAGDFLSSLQTALNSLDVAALRTQALEALAPELVSKGAGASRITDLMTQQEFRQRFSAAIRDQFFASPASAAIQQQLRLFLADLKFTLSQQIDGLFAAAYTIITEQVTTAIAKAPVLGDLKNYINAEVAGHARIEGDSLKELRVDGNFAFRLADDMKFKGYLIIRDVDSSMPGGACRAAYGAATEVMVGAATKIPIMGADADVKADFKAALDSSGVPVGFAGSMGLEGEVGIDNLKVTHAAFGFGFGAGDGYLYGKAAGKMDIGAIKAAAEGRFFVGRTCDLGILQAVDPLVLDVLANPGLGVSVNPTEPIYGFYGYGEGSFSVLSLIGIPPTCMLDLRAGGGMGAFGFYRQAPVLAPPDEPPPPTPYELPPQPARELVLGIRPALSLEGEVLCLVNLGARLDAVFASTLPIAPGEILPKELSGVRGTSVLHLSAEIGVDPFSIEVEHDFRFDFDSNASPRWSLDY